MTTATALRAPEIWMELRDHTALAELMEEQGVSARKLSELAGWKSHTYLQRLLRGEVRTLKTEPALLIAHHLKVPFKLLFVTRVSSESAQNVGGKDRAA